MTVTFVREVMLKYKGQKRGEAFDGAGSPAKAVSFVRRVLPDNVREHFIVLFLNSRHDVIAFFVAATGTASSCPVGVRELFQAAVLAGAVSIIAAHNHPSGDSTPSPEDREVTRRLVEAGTLLGIPLLDHLIVGGTSLYSFKESEEMPTAKSTWPGTF